MNDRKEILDGLLKEYDGAKVLYAKDVAKELGKPSAAAARALMNSDGCPLPVKHVGGRPAVTVFDMATWLAGEPINATQQTTVVDIEHVNRPDASTVPLAGPRNRRESLGKYLVTLRGQREFLFELDAEIERSILADETPEAPHGVRHPPL